jgi:hypothetical protein
MSADAFAGLGPEAPPEPDVSNLLIREERPGTFRALCYDCLSVFDLFGTLAPPTEFGESPIVQRCIDHLHQCNTKRKRIESTQVLQNRNSPHYLLKVIWHS